jgi:hypothetical protein
MSSFYMSQMQAELESEWNAHYDYLSEAYGPTARDAAMFAEGEYEYLRAEALARGEWHQQSFDFPAPLDLVDGIPF